MKMVMNDREYDVEIVRKRQNRNTYLRVKDTGILYVTTNTLVSDKEIQKFILKNEDAIEKMLARLEKRIEKDGEFYYLGKKYDIVFTNEPGIYLGSEKAFVNKNVVLDKWLKKQAEILFKERLDYWYQHFSRKIPYPSLTIRKMKSRWGVCNTKDKRITLNLELLKKEPSWLDYVVVHELSHLVHGNHSSDFWEVVEENCPDYKIIRKVMKDN